MKSFIAFVAILAVASAAQSETDSLLSSALTFVKDCGDKSMVLCLKERALHYVDQTNGNVEVTEGITFVQSEQPAAGGRSLNEIALPTEPEARENEIDSLLVDRVARFMGTHTLTFKVPKDSISDMKRSMDEARKGKKAKKFLLPLLLLFKLKAAALLPLAIGALALIAFKALVIGKLALLLSGILGLKKLFESKGTQSYEVVAHPHASYDEHHGHYARSFDAQNLAYAAHA